MKQVQKNSFISYILSDQVWWCNMKQLLSYFKNCICKFMQANWWHHKLFHFHLSFCIWKVWKRREKIQKFEYLKNVKSFFDEIKNTFHSFGRAIIWWKNNRLRINRLRIITFKLQSFKTVTYFHGQNVQRHKKDKIATLSFPNFVSFYYLSVPEGVRISEIFFAILHIY